MHIDMERSREEYRSRYRNRRYQDKHRLVTDNQRRYLKQSANNSNPSRYSPNHSSISSRHFHYSNNDDDYRPHSSSSSSHFSISNRAKSANTNQINCYESYSPSSRHDRSLNYREVHSPYVNEQSIRSNNFFPPTSSHQRTSPISSSYNDSERNQYISSSSSSSYRRDSSPPPVSSHRNGRLIDHEIRNINNDFYIHSEYRSVTPPSLTSLSHPVEAYVDSYRSNDYASRSQRYESPFNRTNPSSSSNYRNSKNIPVPYESYPFERDYRSISNSRNDEISSYNDRRHFKRPSSKYDNEINPSKRFSRR